MYIVNKNFSYHRETACRDRSVKILSAASQLYENSKGLLQVNDPRSHLGKLNLPLLHKPYIT